MKKDLRIQRAIDESLSSVHFDMQDTHAVLRSIHSRKRPNRSKKKQSSLSLMFAAAMAVLVLTPITLLTLRAGSMTPQDITTITSQGIHTPAATAAGDQLDPLISGNSPAPVSAAFTADDAIAAARACFEANCDTTIFTFDEYTVDVQAEFAYDSDPAGHDYLVTMNSIYGNGCSFRTVVSASGEILSYSAPHLATTPTSLNTESAEILSWYEKYGDHLFTWPLDIQAEFSRRYEGALLRVPRESDISAETVLNSAKAYTREALGLDHSQEIHAYCTLYSERAFSDGAARYQVYCFTGDLTAAMQDDCLLLTILAATGEIESSETVSPDSL